MNKKAGSDLHHLGVRLPQRARDRLARVAASIYGGGSKVTVAQVARGLCLLALRLAGGAVGVASAEPFRIAAVSPNPARLRVALCAFLSLVDHEPPTLPALHGSARATGHDFGGRRGHGLRNQALRLPQRALEELETLARELSTSTHEVSVGEVTRGLCLLALELAEGAAGPEVKRAFCLAASGSTVEDVDDAVLLLQSLFDGAPPTIRDVVDPFGTGEPDTIPEPMFGDCEAPTIPDVPKADEEPVTPSHPPSSCPRAA